MTNRIKIKAETPCYIHDSTFNPYRLTPYVTTNGEVWLEAEGNGAGDDIMLEDISGWSKEEINEKMIDLIKSMGCKEGYCWFEFILDKDNHFYVLEMGYRLLWDKMALVKQQVLLNLLIY